MNIIVITLMTYYTSPSIICILFSDLYSKQCMLCIRITMAILQIIILQSFSVILCRNLDHIYYILV